jgi:hypothetical protein
METEVELYDWLEMRCNQLGRLKEDFEDLLPTFSYFLRQKSGMQEPVPDDEITSLTIPGERNAEGYRQYISFFDIIKPERLRKTYLVDSYDFIMLFRKQQKLYRLAVQMVFTGDHTSYTRPLYYPGSGHMILEPGISEAVLLKLLHITKNINEDPSMDEEQKQDAWFRELKRWQIWQDPAETQEMSRDMLNLYWIYGEAFEDYFRDMQSHLFSLHNMIPLIESFHQCFKNGAGDADLVDFVIRQMEEQILHPVNNRLINAFDLVIAYVKAKMEEIELLKGLDYLRQQPQGVWYGTNTEDIRELIWKQGRLSPSDWQRAFENLGLSDTFQILSWIFNTGPLGFLFSD